MHERPILAANWKMNHGPSEARAFMARFLADYTPHRDRTVVLFPSALAFAAVAESLRNRPDVLVGVQNIYSEAKGAFTGENSAAQARDAGAHLVLVGHSERRHVFGESDEAAGKKVALALGQSLTPMLCVGEKIEQRKAGETDKVVLRQLRTGLMNVSKGDLGNIIIAYEPVWAIGTGMTATPGDAAAVHKVIRAELNALSSSKEVADAVPILYGGSVTKENARALLKAQNVDGLLVGGASLDAGSWAEIAST